MVEYLDHAQIFRVEDECLTAVDWVGPHFVPDKGGESVSALTHVYRFGTKPVDGCGIEVNHGRRQVL